MRTAFSLFFSFSLSFSIFFFFIPLDTRKNISSRVYHRVCERNGEIIEAREYTLLSRARSGIAWPVFRWTRLTNCPLYYTNRVSLLYCRYSIAETSTPPRIIPSFRADRIPRSTVSIGQLSSLTDEMLIVSRPSIVESIVDYRSFLFQIGECKLRHECKSHVDNTKIAWKRSKQDTR